MTQVTTTWLETSDYPLEHEPIYFLLDVLNLGLELLVLVGSDTGSNHRPGNPTSPTKGSLRSDKDIFDVLSFSVRHALLRMMRGFVSYLFLAQQGKME